MLVRRTDQGLTLVETLVALFLLGVAILLAATVVLRARVTQDRALRRTLALAIADGTAERLRATPYPAITSESLDLSGDPAAQELPGATVEISVQEDEEIELKDVVVEVRWKGKDPGFVRLATSVGSLRIYR